ncbi:MAG: MEKHLA domain-containing protein [Aliidongia sp.]
MGSWAHRWRLYAAQLLLAHGGLRWVGFYITVAAVLSFLCAARDPGNASIRRGAARCIHEKIARMKQELQAAGLACNPDFFALLTGSYARLVGALLVAPGHGADWLYLDAPFALLAHDTAPDPHFIYANKTAQACFEYSWDEFTTLPSRLSAGGAQPR